MPEREKIHNIIIGRRGETHLLTHPRHNSTIQLKTQLNYISTCPYVDVFTPLGPITPHDPNAPLDPFIARNS
jgi:hypothetical protein